MRVAVCVAVFDPLRLDLGPIVTDKSVAAVYDLFSHAYELYHPYVPMDREIRVRCFETWSMRGRLPAPDEFLQPLWSAFRLGKLLVQTEQVEGRYDYVIYLNNWLGNPVPIPFKKIDLRKVYRTNNMVMGPSIDMQLYLTGWKRFHEWKESPTPEIDFQSFLLPNAEELPT